MEEELDAQLVLADKALTIVSQFEEAKEKISSALRELRENNTSLARFPCLIFEGCQLTLMSDTEMKSLNQLFLHLCSIQDQRRWSTKSAYTTTKGLRAYRGVCSRRGTPSHNLVHRNCRTSNKCDCKASYTFFSNGNVDFKNGHSDRCLPDSDMGNDGYVFNSGLSPTKKVSIVSNVTDLFGDYGTTAVAARKQIELSLIKSGDIGFGSGIAQ